MMTVDINFEWNESHHLHVIIETERLSMTSIKEEPNYLIGYKGLFSDSVNVAMYTDGQPWSEENVQDRFNTWIARWKNDDAFSAFAISKNDNDYFLGHIILGYGDSPGTSELAYVLDKKYWGMGYGKESVNAIVRNYAPELVTREYKVNNKEQQFESIAATVHSENEASIKILKFVGMRKTGEFFKYGHNRFTFFINTRELMPKSQQTNKPYEKFSPS